MKAFFQISMVTISWENMSEESDDEEATEIVIEDGGENEGVWTLTVHLREHEECENIIESEDKGADTEFDDEHANEVLPITVESEMCIITIA